MPEGGEGFLLGLELGGGEGGWGLGVGARRDGGLKKPSLKQGTSIVGLHLGVIYLKPLKPHLGSIHHRLRLPPPPSAFSGTSWGSLAAPVGPEMGDESAFSGTSRGSLACPVGAYMGDESASAASAPSAKTAPRGAPGQTRGVFSITGVEGKGTAGAAAAAWGADGGGCGAAATAAGGGGEGAGAGAGGCHLLSRVAVL